MPRCLCESVFNKFLASWTGSWMNSELATQKLIERLVIACEMSSNMHVRWSRKFIHRLTFTRFENLFLLLLFSWPDSAISEALREANFFCSCYEAYKARKNQHYGVNIAPRLWREFKLITFSTITGFREAAKRQPYTMFLSSSREAEWRKSNELRNMTLMMNAKFMWRRKTGNWRKLLRRPFWWQKLSTQSLKSPIKRQNKKKFLCRRGA